MKKCIVICIINLLITNTTSFGQTINLAADSITTLLCKKWEVDYAMMGGMKIGRMPGAAEINYEFIKDKTFLITNKDAKDKTKGTWNYDTKKKIITLIINGNSKSTIISLKDGEFVMLVDTKQATPDDPMEIKTVYKIKSN
jgi:hypothetical protein